MKGCICHIVKWQIHPSISDGANYVSHNSDKCAKGMNMEPPVETEQTCNGSFEKAELFHINRESHDHMVLNG